MDNDSVLPEDATVDRSYLAVAHPLVKNTDPSEQSTSDLSLISSRDSSNPADNCWLKVSRTPGRNVDNDSILLEDATVDKSYLAIACPPVEHANSIEESTSDDELFLASHLESSNPADNDCWLKTSRTPGRNVDNDSVLPEHATIDKSYFALA